MNKEWKILYEEAMSVLNPHDVSNKMWVGSVASAVLTKRGNIYKGICIDTDGSIGMCAERNALSTMLTYGESEITKVVSVYKDGNIIPSCGICREFMMHLGGDVENIEILLDKEKNCGHLLYGGRYDRYSHRKRNPCHDGRNTEQPAGLQICGVRK